MKKKICLSIILIVICLLTFVGCSANVNNQEAQKANFVSGTTPFDTLKEFVTTYPSRTSGTGGYQNGIMIDEAKNAGLWIGEQFKNLGYTPSYQDDGLQSFTYNNPFTNRNETGYNVVFKKDNSSTNKKVVIGAHYDNVAKLALNNVVIGGDGTYNNGVGVATLIETAKVLSKETLPFDVEFVAFSAEEVGNFGSLHYVNSQQNLDDIVLMINFDRNAIGDYVYMYSSEAKTEHNKFFYDKSKEHNLCIADLPSFLYPSLIGTATNNGLYVNEAMLTDSDVFLNRGINIVNFISMNFSKNAVENQGMANISYTANDNFGNVIKRLGGEDKAKQIIDKQINSAVRAVYYSLKDANFLTTMENSSANGGLDWMLRADIMSYVAYGIVGGMILIFVILYFSLRPTTKTHDVYINTMYGRVNAKTGQVENGNVNVNKPGDNIGNVFDEFNDKEKQNSNDNAKTAEVFEEFKKDKDKDIFGDY